MATPPSLVQLAFAAGLDESQQGEVLDPLKAFSVLQNVRQDRRGGLSKRLGFGALTRARLDATTRSAGNRLISHKNVTCTIDGTNFDAYSESAAVSAVSSRLPEASVTTRTLASMSSTLYDVVSCNGYIATATLIGVYVTMALETSDGVVARAPEYVVTTSGSDVTAQLGTYGNYIILLVAESGSLNLVAHYLNTTSAATITTGWVSIGNVATDKKSTGSTIPALLTSQSLTNRVAFAYVNNSAGASQITVKTLTIAGVTESTTVNTSTTTPDSITIEGSIADTLWVAWNEGISVKVTGLDADNLAVTLATTATLITTTALGAPAAGDIFVSSKTTAGKAKVAVNDGAGVYLQLRDIQTTAGAVAADGAQTYIVGSFLDARPFVMGGRHYALFRAGDIVSRADSGISVLCDWTDTNVTTTAWLRPVAMAFPSLTSQAAHRGIHPIVGATTAAYAMPVRSSTTGTSIELISYDFADSKRWQHDSHNRSLFLSGGILSSYDRRRVAEATFLHAPRTPTATDALSGSGPNGTYRYVATYEEVDTDGNLHISGVSDPAVVTVTDNSVDLYCNPAVITGRIKPSPSSVESRVSICYYRTLAGGEPPYYLVAAVPNAPAIEGYYVDSTSDAALAGHRLLYGTGNLPGTNGSGQDHRAPPFSQDVISYANMLVVASGSDLWWSGQAVSGEGAWFSPAFVVTCEGPGNITALASQDGTLYVFKRQAIYTVAGEAPSDNGASGGLGSPRKLAGDVGCINPNSVVSTSAGIFFQSDRGIELLNRNGSVVWIGELIHNTLDAFPVVSSAVLDNRNGLVRFSLAAAESGGRISGEGRDAVFDLTLGTWQSIDDKTGASAHEASQDAAMVYVSGSWRYGWIGADGIVYYERLANDASAYLDGSTWVTMAAETSWLKLGGIQGHHHINKVLMLARKSTRANLSTYLSYDYATSSKTVYLRAADDIDALSTAIDRIQLEHQLHDEAEGQAIKVKFADATPTGGTVGTGKGATWIALAFEGVPRAGAAPVPEAGM